MVSAPSLSLWYCFYFAAFRVLFQGKEFAYADFSRDEIVRLPEVQGLFFSCLSSREMPSVVVVIVVVVLLFCVFFFFPAPNLHRALDL